MLGFTILLFTISLESVSRISSACERRDTLYNIVPTTGAQVRFLRELNLKNETLDFWLLTSIIGHEVHVKVPAERNVRFLTELLSQGLNPLVASSNLSACTSGTPQKRAARYTTTESLDFTRRYLRYYEINRYIDYIGRKYPQIVTVNTIGSSFEKRPLRTVTITRNKSNKKAILIDAGIHGREWMAPASALYVIKQLVQNGDTNGDLLNNLTWIILPLVNPDGYEHSHTRDKLWRKNRHPFRRCTGTDGNRNFDFRWGEKGAARHECRQTYSGPKAFSEPETQAVRDLMLANNQIVKLYLTLHSYGRYLLYPWGYRKSLPKTWRLMDAVARAGSDAMKRSHNADYTVGGVGRILYEASGGSDDYALAVARIPIPIVMELPADEAGFHPAPEKIKPFVEEAFSGIRAMARKEKDDNRLVAWRCRNGM
ncbi:carboxypeptidase B1-like [Malaya genurostris]|uniref:carboxypeptidase B1-like n=1 Tax=Malaya genurostris TaxID=325434 RepID=UPI0026F38FC9|nr:carboxypeptidase B1-like [Malaya genurostris]